MMMMMMLSTLNSPLAHIFKKLFFSDKKRHRDRPNIATDVEPCPIPNIGGTVRRQAYDVDFSWGQKYSAHPGLALKEPLSPPDAVPGTIDPNLGGANSDESTLVGENNPALESGQTSDDKSHSDFERQYPGRSACR